MTGTAGFRVAHVLRKYDPAERGGTETHVAEVTRRLGALGFAAEVHAPQGPRSVDSVLAPWVPLIRYRAFCPFLGTAERRRALVANGGNLVSLAGPLRLMRDKSLSLAHVHTGGRIGGGVRTAMRWSARPYLVSVHGPLNSGAAFLSADTARRLAGTVDLGRPLGLLLGARRVIDDAARVICFNDEEQRALTARVGRHAVRMDHGVDFARFAKGNANRARLLWPALGDAPVVVQVARLCAQKDQLLAVRAFARGAPADHRLVLAGPETDRGYRAAIEAEARALGVFGRVHLIGNVEPADVPDLLARARVALVPSLHEAFGLSVLEAWAAGCPALFARVAGLADLAVALGDGAAEFAVRERTPEAWAAALRRLLENEATRAAAAEAGASLAKARFSWDGVAARLAALYSEVLAEAGRA